MDAVLNHIAVIHTLHQLQQLNTGKIFSSQQTLRGLPLLTQIKSNLEIDKALLFYVGCNY